MMRAHAGDHIVVASPATGGVVRDGKIIEVRGTDGAPPYVVLWSDRPKAVLYFPGADAHIDDTQTKDAALPEPPAAPPHVRSWRVNIDLFESGDDTTAHAVLIAESPSSLDARGEAHRKPSDQPVPEIGDEIAVARALRRLSDRLLETASADITGVTGHGARVST
jgi:Domain of unknown function (DUF1876)/Domain of unknown function (DUF1918)